MVDVLPCIIGVIVPPGLDDLQIVVRVELIVRPIPAIECVPVF